MPPRRPSPTTAAAAAPTSGVSPDLLSQLARVKAEVDRRRWLADPVLWVRERLNGFVWSKQKEIMYAVRDHRLVSVPSCHGVGKSRCASMIVCWWIDTHPPGEAFVVTTATTWKQVEAVLWREIRRVHTQGKLLGRTNRTEWLMPIPGAAAGPTGQQPEELIAFGHRPADTDPTAFQGIHAPAVLVVVDEACGVPKAILESADSLISNADSRMLLIGNPDDPLSEFANVSKPNSGWRVIHISAFDCPNFTGEVVPPEIGRQLVSPIWVKEKKHRWGETNPLYISKVLGQFPEFSDDGLIPMHWVRNAQNRYSEFMSSHATRPAGWDRPCELGVDVGGGGDKNVIALRQGPLVTILCEDREPDTMKTKEKILRHLNTSGAACAKVDSVGIGRGAVQQAQRESRLPVIGIEAAGRAREPSAFLNLRAEGYWQLRMKFQNGEIMIDPRDEDLAAQLVDLRYDSVSGRIQIESKDSMKRRGKSSPDRADAVMLAMLDAPRKHKLTWGRRRRGGDKAA